LADRAGLDWTVIVAYEGGYGVPILESFVKIAWARRLAVRVAAGA
jgi:hypothetical protein